MKTIHIYRPANSDPGLESLVIEDSNTSPYIPGSYDVLASGALAWDGRDEYVSACAGCDATGDDSPCAQRVMLRDLVRVIVHEVDVATAKVA